MKVLNFFSKLTLLFKWPTIYVFICSICIQFVKKKMLALRSYVGLPVFVIFLLQNNFAKVQNGLRKRDFRGFVKELLNIVSILKTHASSCFGPGRNKK